MLGRLLDLPIGARGLLLVALLLLATVLWGSLVLSWLTCTVSPGPGVSGGLARRRVCRGVVVRPCRAGIVLCLRVPLTWVHHIGLGARVRGECRGDLRLLLHGRGRDGHRRLLRFRHRRRLSLVRGAVVCGREVG